MSLHQGTQGLISIPGQQRGHPGIERDETDLEVFIPHPKRQVVLARAEAKVSVREVTQQIEVVSKLRETLGCKMTIS